MWHLLGLRLLFVVGTSCATAATASDEVSCAASEGSIQEREHQESSIAQTELLQFQSKLTKSTNNSSPGGKSVASLGGDHRYLLVRPCARFAGDGMSGLPRHRVTGECCGDSICSAARFEDSENCAADCTESSTLDQSAKNGTEIFLPPTESTLFGVLEGMEHDEYHCSDEGEYQSTCSKERNYSVWLESLLERSKNGTLPFDLPPPGSVAVEFGCGKGQDSRNIASMAGYALTAVDVSPSAIKIATNTTPQELMGTGPGQIEFVAYDATALPVPTKRVDFFFDATVYCGLRHTYLPRLYGVWSRVFTPGHTLVHIQCWNWEYMTENIKPVPRTQRDMEADFEPMFDILHSEKCEKNQDGPGWCFYMKLKAPEVRAQLEADRLKMQQAARDGDINYVRQSLDARSGRISEGEFNTLYYTAQANGHLPLMKYLTSIYQKEDPFFQTVYGRDADLESVEAEDQTDGDESRLARMELKLLKTDWERAEAMMILQARIDRLVNQTGAHW